MVMKDLIYNTIGIYFIVDGLCYSLKVVNQLVVISQLRSFKEDRLQMAQLVSGVKLHED